MLERRKREKERDKLGFLLLPCRWKIAGFNTFPIAKLIYINIQSREWKHLSSEYRANIGEIKSNQKLDINVTRALYVLLPLRFSSVGTAVVIGFPRRSRASIVGNRHRIRRVSPPSFAQSRHALIPAIYFEKGHGVEHRGLRGYVETYPSDYFRNLLSAILQSLPSFV